MTELKLEDVIYRYKGTERKVVDNVNCSFEGGQLSAILGPSGSGKTTLLSLMAGLDSPSQGSVLLNDMDLREMDLNQYRREKVSMIFQSFQLFPLLTAIENVSFPMELNGHSADQAAEKSQSLLESVGIDKEKHKRYPSNLSGGEQQRVAIARSLGTGAQVLLADEPTGNLDKANGENVIEILRQLAHEQDYCVIVVTHNLEIAKKADRVWQMSDGVLEEMLR